MASGKSGSRKSYLENARLVCNVLILPDWVNANHYPRFRNPCVCADLLSQARMLSEILDIFTRQLAFDKDDL
jgi:hypothetical protein